MINNMNSDYHHNAALAAAKCSIGYFSAPGKFRILATMNNSQGEFTLSQFSRLKDLMTEFLQDEIEARDIVQIPRCDVPDWVQLPDLEAA